MLKKDTESGATDEGIVDFGVVDLANNIYDVWVNLKPDQRVLIQKGMVILLQNVLEYTVEEATESKVTMRLTNLI